MTSGTRMIFEFHVGSQGCNPIPYTLNRVAHYKYGLHRRSSEVSTPKATGPPLRGVSGSCKSSFEGVGFKGLGFKGLGFKGLGFKGLGFRV